MNRRIITSYLVCVVIMVSLCSCKPGDALSDTDRYLGQEPPGTKPEVFAPGIVSTKDHHEFSCTFSADGKEFYFNRGMVIMVCRWENGVWTEPRPVSFTGDFRSHEPYITLDNTRLFYGSMRPQPEYPESEEPYGIWMVKRTPEGWSNPVYVGYGMYVTATRSGTIYLTDIRGTTHLEQGIAKTTLKDDRFTELVRQKGGVVNPAPDRMPGRHPFIAPDESFILFDAYEKDTAEDSKLFVCFREGENAWGEAVELGAYFNTLPIIAAYISPDGKYLFFSRNSDIYWVDAKIIEELKPEEIK